MRLAHLIMWYVYIIECKDGTLYTGATTDLARRFLEHQSGAGARYTRAHGAVRLVYQEALPSRSAAYKREAEIKHWPRSKKLELTAASACQPKT